MSELQALLRGSIAPSEEQKAKILLFLQQKYGGNITLRWEKDDAIINGFRLEIGSAVYDWSLSGRFAQLKETLAHLPFMQGDIMPLMQDAVADWAPRPLAEETGRVATVGDGIATVTGLDHAAYGEILLFASGIRGMVQDLRRESIGCILFGDDAEIEQGSAVRRTGRMASITTCPTSSLEALPMCPPQISLELHPSTKISPAFKFACSSSAFVAWTTCCRMTCKSSSIVSPSFCLYTADLSDLDDRFSTHVHSQRLRDADRAVVVEVVLQKCNQHTRRSHNGVVQGVWQVGLFGFLVLDTDAKASCLSIAQVGAAANLKVFLLTWAPCLYVQALDLQVCQVAGAALQGADRDVQIGRASCRERV